MFAREVIECQEHVAVFGQFGGDLVVFHAICRDEVVECGCAIRPNQLQDAVLLLGHSGPAIDPIRPDVYEPPRAQVAPLPTVILIPPIGFEP